MGGSDNSSNIVELTIEEHAEAHRKLYEEYGHWQDKLAYKMLSGQISAAEATKEAQRNGQIERWSKYTSEERSMLKSGKNNPMYGKTLSENHKTTIGKANRISKPWVSETMKKRHAAGTEYKWTSEDNPRKTKVSIDGIIYDTIKEASISLNMNYSKLRDRLNSKNFQNYFRV